LAELDARLADLRGLHRKLKRALDDCERQLASRSDAECPVVHDVARDTRRPGAATRRPACRDRDGGHRERGAVLSRRLPVVPTGAQEPEDGAPARAVARGHRNGAGRQRQWSPAPSPHRVTDDPDWRCGHRGAGRRGQRQAMRLAVACTPTEPAPRAGRRSNRFGRHSSVLGP